SSPQGAEEEDAAGGYFPRDEAPRALRKALREEGPRKGGSRAPRAQAGPQEVAARRPAADEAEAGVRRGSRRRRARRSRWRPRRCGRRTPSALSQVQISRYENAGPGPAFFCCRIAPVSGRKRYRGMTEWNTDLAASSMSSA